MTGFVNWWSSKSMIVLAMFVPTTLDCALTHTSSSGSNFSVIPASPTRGSIFTSKQDFRPVLYNSFCFGPCPTNDPTIPSLENLLTDCSY